MSSGHPPRHEPSSRTWWSLSSKPSNGLKSDKELRRAAEKTKPMPKFSTLTSAFGLKAKKRSSFPVPETLSPTPPPPLKLIVKSPSNDASMSPRPQARPATMAGSVLRPKGTSMQPRTAPEMHKDTHANRLSLLTLTDVDPFAARGMSFVHSTQEHDQPPKRTNTSAPEISQKTVVSPSFLRRSSIASTSSQSQSHGGDISRNSSVARSLGSGLSRSETKSSQKKSKGGSESVREKSASGSSQNRLGSSRENVMKLGEEGRSVSKTSSSTSSPERSRPSEPDLTRPPMRASGITNSVSVPTSNTRPQLRSPSTATTSKSSSPSVSRQTSSSSSRPRVVVRQASLKEVGPAPRAPPSHGLPPPPEDVAPARAVTPSSQSSTLSFASVMSDARVEGDDSSRRRTLKGKARSQHDLPKKADADSIQPSIDDRASKSSASVTFASPVGSRTTSKATPSKASNSGHVPSLPPADRIDKSLRKQHSFHNTNQPSSPTPVPLRHASSFNPPPISKSPSQQLDDSQLLEQRRGSSGALGLPTRKRLFSGSSLRRPSTARSRTEEDALSIFSLPLDTSREPLNRAVSSSIVLSASDTTSSLHSSSFWEEQPTPTTSDHSPNSPIVSSPSEYIPQQIMSPAEMLRIEASVMADLDPDESEVPGRSRGYSFASISTSVSEGAFSLTSQEAHSVSPKNNNAERGVAHRVSRLGGVPSRNNSIIDDALNGRSRRTPRPTTADSLESISARPPSSSGSKPFSLPLVGLPPPPRPRPLPPVTLPDDPVVPLKSPPIRSQNLRPKTSGETVKQRRSILKKPSFLEIEDEPEKLNSNKVESSFLDFGSGKESFDTFRSIESEQPR